MGNSFISETQIWTVDSTGTLNTGGVTVMKVILWPSAVSDDLVLTDNADNEAISLKASPSDTSAVQIDFGPDGRRLPSLKVGTIDNGPTTKATIYFKKTTY